MKIVNLHHPLSSKQSFDDPIVLAMGFFDGVHLGHQGVIEKAKKIAKKERLPLGILTYDHHPGLVYNRLTGDDKRYLTLKERRMKLFENLGVDIVYEVNYTYAFQAQNPKTFVENYLLGLNTKVVVAGFDHTYGQNKEDNMRHLDHYTNGKIQVITVKEIDQNGRKISSTRIRHKLSQGNIKLVNSLLGYSFETKGTVMHGFARGRKLGYPTANISYDEEQLLPGIGIYIVKIKIGNKWFEGMASVGRNVTFGNNTPITVEINILDFNKNIYGEKVKVAWLDKIRGEVKFSKVADLIKQLKIDEDVTRNYFLKNKH